MGGTSDEGDDGPAGGDVEEKHFPTWPGYLPSTPSSPSLPLLLPPTSRLPPHSPGGTNNRGVTVLHLAPPERRANTTPAHHPPRPDLFPHLSLSNTPETQDGSLTRAIHFIILASTVTALNFTPQTRDAPTLPRQPFHTGSAISTSHSRIPEGRGT